MATQITRLHRRKPNTPSVKPNLVEETIRLAFYRSISKIRFSPEANDIVSKATGPLEVAIKSAFAEFSNVLVPVYTEYGRAAYAKVWRDRVRKAPMISFSPDNARASSLVTNARLKLVQDLSQRQLSLLQRILREGIERGDNPRLIARRIREAIGLTENQAEAVARYRELLENGSGEALERALRDARSDGRLLRALEEGQVLNESTIDTMVGRYYQNMVNYRADNIARTETHTALSAAQHEGVLQAVEGAEIPEDSVSKTWNSTHDHRTRDTHVEMDGQTVPLHAKFESPSGALLLYPGDPEAPADEVIRCRCVLTYNFAEES